MFGPMGGPKFEGIRREGMKAVADGVIEVTVSQLRRINAQHGGTGLDVARIAEVMGSTVVIGGKAYRVKTRKHGKAVKHGD